MPQRRPFCPSCGQIFSGYTSKCSYCGRRFHKTVVEAYTSGLGLFDLIPGIRDLPDPLRYGLMLIVLFVILSALILGPVALKYYHHVAR